MNNTETPQAARALEQSHPQTEDSFWQESWYFNFSDPKAGVWGLTRIGYRPSKNTADGLLIVFIDGKAEILYAPVSCQLDDTKTVTIDPPGSLKTKGLIYKCESPLKVWHLQTKHDNVTLNLRFESTTPTYIFPSLAAQSTKTPASDHYEQSGRVSGSITWQGKEKHISGTGQRDHSWGPRDWSGIGDWEWLSGQFESGWCFNFWAVGQGRERTVTGFVGYPDKNIAIVDGQVTWLGNAKKPRGAKVLLILEDGTHRELDYFVQGHWPLYKDGLTIMEMFCTYECDGEKGSGISEHAYRDPMFIFKVPGLLLKYGTLALRFR